MKQADKGETASTLSNEPAPDPRAPERQEPVRSGGDTRQEAAEI